jgi:hypothetical protein
MLMHTAGFLMGRALFVGNAGDYSDYRGRALYLEFENVADVNDVVSPPEVDAEDSLQYYLDLSSSVVRDFVRIPFTPAGVAMDVHPDYAEVLDDAYPNRTTIRAATSAVTGYHGRAFTTAAKSKIFGVALVACPSINDVTRDILLAREYYETTSQLIKPSSGIVEGKYVITFRT